MSIKASGMITIVDINDAIVSIVAPINPVVGTLWLDTTNDVNVLKRWDGSTWEIIGDLDPSLKDKLDAINATINNMTDDNLIVLKERQDIKDRLTDILGLVIANTTTTMPTTVTLDAGLKGSFYASRKSALNAGILSNDAGYILVATRYNTLKTYLEGITPIDVWDTGEANRNVAITVVKTTFRDRWLQYYIAVDSLNLATTAQLKKNADNIQVGGKNLIRNSTFNKRTDAGILTDWTSINPIWEAIDGELDKPNSAILKAVMTGNSSDIYYNAFSNTFPAKLGDVLTFSVEFKTTIATAWDVKTPFVAEFYNSIGTRVQFLDATTTLMGITVADGIWYRGFITATVTTSTVTSCAIRPTLVRNGELFIREVQVERGNKMLDWKVAPEDNLDQINLLEIRVADAEQVFKDGAFVSTVMESVSFKQQMEGKLDSGALADYLDADALEEKLLLEQGIVDGKINGIDYTPYVTQTQFTQSADEINAKFATGGGVNLVRNSTGIANTDFWSVTGTINSARSDDLEKLNFIKGFTNPIGVSGQLDQVAFTEIGQYHTISFYMNKESDNATNGYAGIELLESDGTSIQFVGKDSLLGITNGYEKFTYSWMATSETTTIRLKIGINTQSTIAGIMLNIGFDALQWSMANGEVYNTNVQFDINGIRVIQQQDGVEVGRTVMTPEKFAGYYDTDGNGNVDETNNSNDEVFRMDKDEFVMKKAVIKEELTMGTLKVITINTTGTNPINGWAWVSNETS